MRILVFEPLKEPYVKDIEDDIQAMQELSLIHISEPTRP